MYIFFKYDAKKAVDRRAVNLTCTPQKSIIISTRYDK